MIIVSWNVANRNISLVFLYSYVELNRPDIICLQEVSVRLYKMLESEKTLCDYHKYYNKRVRETTGGIVILSKQQHTNTLFDEIDIIEKSRINGIEFDNFILITFYYPMIYYDVNLYTKHYKYVKETNVKNNNMKKTIHDIIIRSIKQFENYKPIILCGDLNEEYKSEYYLSVSFENQKRYIKSLENVKKEREIFHRNKKIYELEHFSSALVDFSNLGYADVYLKFIHNDYHNNIDYFFVNHKIFRLITNIKQIKNTGSDHHILELSINI
jgi:exonuclease III